MIKFDKTKVTHIQIQNLVKTEFIWLEEIEEKRTFFDLLLLVVNSKAGYYREGSRKSFRIDTVEEGSVDINGVLHWLPYVRVYINSEVVGLKYFNKLEDAITWCDKEFQNVNYSVS